MPFFDTVWLKERYYMKNIFFSGVVFLFAIFVIYCLTSFAMLAYESANNDLMLAEKNAEYIDRYYDADKRAAQLIGRIDEMLVQSRKESKNMEEYKKIISNRLSEEENKFILDGNNLSFNVMLNDTQRISVTMEILDKSEEKRFRITQYRLNREEIWDDENAEENNIKGMWKG